MNLFNETKFVFSLRAKCKICFNRYHPENEVTGMIKQNTSGDISEARFLCSLCGAKLGFNMTRDSIITFHGALIEDIENSPSEVASPNEALLPSQDPTNLGNSAQHSSILVPASFNQRCTRADKELARADKARDRLRRLRRAYGVPEKALLRNNPKVSMITGATSSNVTSSQPQMRINVASKRRRKELAENSPSARLK